MVAQAILQIRLYALYSLNKKVLALMLTFYFSCAASSVWIIVTELSDTLAVVVLGRFCLPIGIPHRFYTYWIPMVSYESLLCGLALFQGFRTFRSGGSMFRNGKRLVGIMVRDSILYFLVICATYLTCLVLWAVTRTTLHEVPIGFTVALSCVLANRIVLNVRKMSKNVELASSRASTRTRIIIHDTSTIFYTPGSLTPLELERLRTMRAEKCHDEL